MKKFILKYHLGIVGTIFLILFETTTYFITKLFETYPHIIYEFNFIKIPFNPYFVYFYCAWYLMLFIIPMHLYIKDKNTYYKYFTSNIISIIISNIIFIIYPTTIIRGNITTNNIASYILNIIYKLDTPILNCLPSTHCLLSFLFIYSLIDTKEINIKFKLIYIIMSILVVLSTLFIKQHVMIDVISALIISIFAYIIVNITNIHNKVNIFIEKNKEK